MRVKKYAIRTVLIVFFTCVCIVAWQSKTEILSFFDECVSNVVSLTKKDNTKNTKVSTDLKEYYDGEFFKIDEYLEDLGFSKMPFSKKENIAVYRRYGKKVTIKSDGTITYQIHNDKNQDGITIEIQKTYGPYFISYGSDYLKQRTDDIKIYEITSLIANLKDLETISEVSEKTDNELKSYYQKILKGSS